MNQLVEFLQGIGWQRALVGVAIFLTTFLASALTIGYLIVRLPETFFLDSHRRDEPAAAHPVRRIVLKVLKNALGAGLVVLGLVLSLPGVPGQGLLTILLGVVLLDIPGKRKLERAILRRPAVLRSVNHLRARYGKPPLVVDEPNADEESGEEHSARSEDKTDSTLP